MEMVTNLVFALEQATLMAKQLHQTTGTGITTDPTQTLQIHSALHAAHFQLSSFLSRTALIPPPQPSLNHHHLPPPATDNSFSSSSNDADDMVVGGEDEVEEVAEIEQNSKTSDTDGVLEEQMREFFIKSKRPKRPLSPSAVVVGEKQRRRESHEFVRDDQVELDQNSTSRLKALELIYQFHS